MKWVDVAIAAGAQNEDDAENLLWSGSAFPFAPPRVVYEQIRHTVRHKVCFDDPSASCAGRRVKEAWRGQ